LADNSSSDTQIVIVPGAFGSIIFPILDSAVTSATHIEVTCLADTQIASAYCRFSSKNVTNLKVGVNQTIRSELNSMLKLNNTFSISVHNDQPSQNFDEVTFFLPTITFYHHGLYTDLAGISSSVATDHSKALLYSMPILAEYGRIRLDTIWLENAYPIPDLLSPVNLPIEGTNLSFTTLPMLASETRIIGFNVLETSTLHLWSVGNHSESNSLCFTMELEATSDFVISYIVIDTSSLSFWDALEIWHHSFLHAYLTQPLGSGSWITDSSPESCLVYNAKFSWTNRSLAAHPAAAPFWRYNPFLVTLAGDLDDNCSAVECQIVLEAGFRTESGGFVMPAPDTYAVGWHPLLERKMEGEIAGMESYRGLFFDFFDSTAATFGNQSDQFVLKDGAVDVKPVIARQFAVLSQLTAFPDGYLFLGSWIHPQLTTFVASAAVNIRLMETGQPFAYSAEIRGLIWKLRVSAGSLAITLIETSDPRQMLLYINEYLSIALLIGAFPSWNSQPGVWNSCPPLEAYATTMAKWVAVFVQVLDMNYYYPNLNSMVLPETGDDGSPPISGNNSFYEATMFCQPASEAVEGEIACYVNVLVCYEGDLPEESVEVTVSLQFLSSESPDCFFVPDKAGCDVTDNIATVSLIGAMLRTVTLRYYTMIKTEPGSWIEENMLLVFAVSIPLLLVLVGLGLAVWYMFFRRPTDNEHLARIIRYERAQKKRKIEVLKGRKAHDEISESSDPTA
jgi:hypothetical protein